MRYVGRHLHSLSGVYVGLLVCMLNFEFVEFSRLSNSLFTLSLWQPEKLKFRASDRDKIHFSQSQLKIARTFTLVQKHRQEQGLVIKQITHIDTQPSRSTLVKRKIVF